MVYPLDWYNIDLNSAYERDMPIIDGLSFDSLLLEIECNLREINEQTVMAQFEEDLRCRVDESRSIMKSNLKNIVRYANEYRDRE